MKQPGRKYSTNSTCLCGKISSGIMPKAFSLRWAVGLAIGVAVLFGVAWEARHMLNPEPRFIVRDGVAPLRRLVVRMDESEFERFRTQMVKFADAFGFENKSKYSSPDPYDYFFILQRSDVDLLSTNDTDRGRAGLKVSVDLYPKSGRAPPPAQSLDVLVDGLKKYLALVQGAVLTEVTRPR
jgi:hypothetical protein